ncbi:MAG: EAL domain-containing protein [Rhizobiales bacterium]|nr:EAL domain-containing protein [Hyphomicrobiales bacterium]
MMLIPTWILLVFWLVSATISVMGGLDNEIVQPALAGGMVLIVLLIGFTLMQHAFTGGTVITGEVGDQQRRALALTGSGDMIWDWDVMRDRMVVSPEVEQKLGLRRGTLESHARDWLEFLHQSDRDRFRLMLDTVLVQRRGRIVQEFRLRSQADDYHWFSLRARPVVGSDGEVVRCVGTLTDITEEKIAQERLMHDAVHDNLTGLPNRELFLDRLQIALTRSEVDDSGYPSIILVDIDQFSDVNDSYGLAIGDSVLLAISRRLSRITRPQDTLARVSGDQFVLMLISEEDTAKVEAIAAAVLRTIKSSIPIGDDEVYLSASVGIAHFEEEQIEAADLLRQAETALYDAKRQGGNAITVFSDVSSETTAGRMEVATRLRRALANDELVLYYQPIIRLEDRSIAGFEALMRWQHPEHGTLAPSEFIPIAEESNLISDIGLFALEEATQQLAEWQQSPKVRVPLFMNVNVSSRQLFSQDLINDVKSVFLRSPVQPGSLKLEITESLVMENPEYAAQVLNRLRDLGAGLALDDFGTGHSSLSYLQRFPFDTLKVDKSFVRQNGQESQLVILRSIIALAHDLDMDVIGEGAENESDVLELSEQECEYAQGFLFGMPMIASEAEEMLFRNTSFGYSTS